MAERSGPTRVIALILVGLGVFFLAVAILVPVYAKPKLAKTPLDLEVTLNTESPGRVLDASSLMDDQPGVVIDDNVPIATQRFVVVEDPSDADIITVQAGLVIRRLDKEGNTGLLSATVDRVTGDRVTMVPSEDHIGSIQSEADQPAVPVEHTGLQYKWPLNAEKKSYPYFDIFARRSEDIDYVDEARVQDLDTYHYHQVTQPADLSKANPADPTNKLTLPAESWGIEGGQIPITMTRWYTVERDIWVEPRTGAIIKGQEEIHQYYARNKDRPEIDAIQLDATFDEATQVYQADQARDAIKLLDTFGKTLPIISGIVGIVLTAAGVALGIRGQRKSNGGRGNGNGGAPVAPPTTPIPTGGGAAAPPQ